MELFFWRGKGVAPVTVCTWSVKLNKFMGLTQLSFGETVLVLICHLVFICGKQTFVPISSGKVNAGSLYLKHLF